MTAIKNYAELAKAYEDGKYNTYSFRKNPTQATTAGTWFDLALSPGNPVPKFWFGTPLTATPIKQSTDWGFYHGAAGNTSITKYLRKTQLIATAATALPMTLTLQDYLLYYPLIDDGTTDQQDLVNTESLPRYTDGKGVQIMAISVAGRTGGQSFFVTYTNQNGVSGRISKTVMQNSSANLGVVLTSFTATNANTCVYIPLQEGDTGVRSIQSVKMLGADVGLFSLVLVKPLGQTQIIGTDAPVETDFLLQNGEMTEIKDDAFLSYVCCPNGSLAATGIMADLTVVWN